MSHSLFPEPRHIIPRAITLLPYGKHQRVKFPKQEVSVMGEMQEMHLGLHQQLQQFQMSQQQIAEAITETQRRTSVLEEAMSWSPVVAEADQAS